MQVLRSCLKGVTIQIIAQRHDEVKQAWTYDQFPNSNKQLSKALGRSDVRLSSVQLINSYLNFVFFSTHPIYETVI